MDNYFAHFLRMGPWWKYLIRYTIDLNFKWRQAQKVTQWAELISEGAFLFSQNILTLFSMFMVHIAVCFTNVEIRVLYQKWDIISPHCWLQTLSVNQDRNACKLYVLLNLLEIICVQKTKKDRYVKLKICELDTKFLQNHHRRFVEISQNFVAFSEYMNFTYANKIGRQTWVIDSRCFGKLSIFFITNYPNIIACQFQPKLIKLVNP